MAYLTRRGFTNALFASAAGGLLLPKLRAQDACAPPAGTPEDFVIPKLQNIQRKAIATLTQNEVDRLRLAYSKLRALTESDANDPRGWQQQANVHCWQCGASGTDIHQAWTFLPWHRAYLYFHERILCKLLNDNSFRLPYWSWDFANTRSLPPIYRPDKVGGKVNSLFDDARSAAAVAGKSMPNSIFPKNRNPMNATSFASFGGSADEGGALENGPHGAIHMWTGSPNDPNPDMGNLSTAARDPIFYAHHCNIDRLWSVWIGRGHANPSDGEFLTQSFLFFDENSKLRKIRVQDVLDSAPLGFSYPPDAGLAKKVGPAKWTKLDYDTTTKLLKLPTPAPMSSLIQRTRSLVLKEVAVPTTSGLYNVFAGDVPAANADQAGAPNYLGYIGLIVGHHSHDRKCSLVLDASNEFLQRAGGAGAVITFAPAGTTDGVRLEYGSAYITEE